MNYRRPFVWLFLALACLVRADDLNVTGTFFDKGTQIGEDGSDPEMVSLHGLFSLEFAPHIHAADFLDATRVIFVERDNKLDIEIHDDAGKRIWADLWTAADGYSTSEEGAVVRIQSKTREYKRAVFIMNKIDDGRILQVRAFKVGTTIFGPNAKPIGTYVFIRAD